MYFAMKPERMVETGHDDRPFVERQIVRDCAYTQKFVVGYISQQVLMQRGIVGQRINGAKPHVFHRRLARIGRHYRTNLERALVCHMPAHFLGHLLYIVAFHFENVFAFIRPGHIRHACLVFDAWLGALERCCQVENWPAVLNRNDASIGKTAAVAGSIDLVDDRCIHITATQEIRME